MKTMYFIFFGFLLSFLSAMADGKHVDLNELSEVKAQKILSAEGYSLDEYAPPVVFCKGSELDPIAGWAKKFFGKKKLAELDGVDYLVVEFKSKNPRPGGITLIVFTADKNLTLLARSGLK